MDSGRSHNKTEWIKALITQFIVLFLFTVLNTEIMGWFNRYILPTLSMVNEGVLTSILFGVIFLFMIIFWFNRFKCRYYVKPLYVLSSFTLSSIYWFYRLFTDDYIITPSDLFHIGFSDIIYISLLLFGITSLSVDLIDLDEPTPNETPNEDKFPLLEDSPITSRDQDRLGFGDEVDTLYKRIIERKTTTALSIGINARWGDGKSSFINLLYERFLQKKNLFIVIRFNPRYSTNDTIQSAFFENLYSELSKYDSRFKSSFNDYLRVIDVMTENKYLSVLFHTSTLFNRDCEKSRINEAIKRLKKLIIVIIEDLDRLTGDEIIEVFKLIDGNASFDNLIFISAYDKRRINKLLESTDEWTAFSDKFFTWEYPLPLRSSKLLLDYLKSNLTSGLNFKTEEVEEINRTITANASFFTNYLKNLRDVKRYINLVKPSLSKIYKDIKTRDYLLIELLRYKFPQEHRDLYEQNSFQDSETNSKQIVTIEGLEERYQSKDILKVLFPTDGDSSYRSINSIGGFSIYFQEQVFEHFRNVNLNLMFEIGQDYKSIIKLVADNQGFNELNRYLDSRNTLSFLDWNTVARYIDIYIYLNSHYNETKHSIEKVGILLETNVAQKLCEKFKISISDYKSILSQKLTGSNVEYPYTIVGQKLWEYKSGNLTTELIFSDTELLDILKCSLKDLLRNNNNFTTLHNKILRFCISSIAPISKRITLDVDACKMILHSIKRMPDEYISNFVFLAGVSSSPDWNSITCDPFWMQIFISAENLKDFIFNEKLDALPNIKRVRNFWSIFEANNYEPIEFHEQGPVQAKIDSDLVTERKLLDEILNIESVVNSIIIPPDSFVDAYKILIDSLELLSSNTLHIKKNGEVRKSILKKRDELKLFIASEPLEISPEILTKIKLSEDYLNEHLR